LFLDSETGKKLVDALSYGLAPLKQDSIDRLKGYFEAVDDLLLLSNWEKAQKYIANK